MDKSRVGNNCSFGGQIIVPDLRFHNLHIRGPQYYTTWVYKLILEFLYLNQALFSAYTLDCKSTRGVFSTSRGVE